MKVFVSVDIEGAAGVAHWDEALRGRPGHEPFCAIMTGEAVAACAREVWVRDARESARNIDPEALPSGVRLVRGWSGHPFKMLQELDASFDAVAMIGWHGPAGDGGNPLSHTMTGRFARMTLNGGPMSEFVQHAHVAGLVGVPGRVPLGRRSHLRTGARAKSGDLHRGLEARARRLGGHAHARRHARGDPE